jgi:hypothetical protein
MILDNRGFGDAKRDIEIKTGKIAGYRIGAGSKEAGIRIRWRSRRVEGGFALQEW